MGAQVNDSQAWTVCRCHRRSVLLKQKVIFINGENPAVILVRVRYHSNRHWFILAPGCINTKWVLPSFEKATETMTLGEKCFRPFNRHLADTSLFDLTLAYTRSSRVSMLNFFWTNRALFHCMLSEKWVKSMRYCQIKRNFRDSDYLYKLAKNI